MRIRSAASKLQCLATASELRDVARSTCHVAEMRHCEYKMAEFRLDAEHRFLVALLTIVWQIPAKFDYLPVATFKLGKNTLKLADLKKYVCACDFEEPFIK